MAKQKYLLTQEDYDKLVRERQKIIEVDIPNNLEDLNLARSQGDLSENADYDAAKSEQSRLNARIEEPERSHRQLRNHQIRRQPHRRHRHEDPSQGPFDRRGLPHPHRRARRLETLRRDRLRLERIAFRQSRLGQEGRRHRHGRSEPEIRRHHPLDRKRRHEIQGITSFLFRLQNRFGGFFFAEM